MLGFGANSDMGGTEVKTPLREVRLRVAACFALIMLSCDAVNPVKIICGILNVSTIWALVVFIIAFCVVVAANANELAYFSVKVFFHSIMTIFFSSMEVLGKQNIPEHGPVIFVGNHMNQFVDGAVMMITNPKKVSFLVAEKSHKSAIVGRFTHAIGSIPVARPQDKTSPGAGRIYFDGTRIIGEGTAFTKLQKGDKIRPGRSPDSYKVKTVISDTEGILADEYGEASPLKEHVCQGVGKWTTYDILAYVDQSGMFSAVEAALANGGCLGLFPEGGSHDNTDLLPLKAGVAAIALGCWEKYGITVPIVPVGLNYFRGHHFRGRVVVEFGKPIHMSKELIETYKSSKRQGYQSLLGEVEDGMRSVIVTASNYDELKLIHTIRRLYQRSPTEMKTIQKQDFARRFSLGYKFLKEKYAGQKLPEDLETLQKKIIAYQDELDKWGLRDYQLMTESLETNTYKTLYTFFHGWIIITLACIPSAILNAPVGFAANIWSQQQAAKDLKASRVKVAARDVLLSYKIVFSIVAVPLLWITYAILLVLFSNLQYRTIAVLFLCCPFFSYLNIMAVQTSIRDFKDLRPVLLRLMPSYRDEMAALPKLRASLQKEVREMVKKYGPATGPLYYEKGNNWEKLFRKTVMKNLHSAKPNVAVILPETGEDAAGSSNSGSGSSSSSSSGDAGVTRGGSADDEDADGVVVDKEDSVPPSTRTSESETVQQSLSGDGAENEATGEAAAAAATHKDKSV